MCMLLKALAIPAFLFWIFCVGCVGGRSADRGFDNMEVPMLMIWSVLTTLFGPLMLVYDLIRHGWHNNR